MPFEEFFKAPEQALGEKIKKPKFELLTISSSNFIICVQGGGDKVKPSERRNEKQFEFDGEMYSLVEEIEDIDDLVEAIRIRNILEHCTNTFEPDSNHPCFWMYPEQDSIITNYTDEIGDFDKSVLISNISSLLKEHGIKIGELEEILGISAGYISRAANSERKLSIDVVWKIAQLFNCSLYSLLEIDRSNLSGRDKFYCAFLEKLIRETEDQSIEWEKELAEKLNRENGGNHPLMSEETFYEESECEYPEEVTRVVMVSNSFDCKTAIAGNCYNTPLGDGAKLYLMSISKSVYRERDANAFAKEIWITNPNGEKSYMCSTKEGIEIGLYIEKLYSVIADKAKYSTLDAFAKQAIEAFMKGEK